MNVTGPPKMRGPWSVGHLAEGDHFDAVLLRIDVERACHPVQHQFFLAFVVMD